MRSSSERELASEFVPNTARPTFCEEQPPALAREALGVGREIGLEGRDHRREHAGDALDVVHDVASMCGRLTYGTSTTLPW